MTSIKYDSITRQCHMNNADHSNIQLQMWKTAVKNLEILILGSPNPMFDENKLITWTKFHGL